MFECSFIWRDKSSVDGTPLDHWCRCIRTHGHEGEHRCMCTPINFFTMRYAGERE